MNKFDIIIIGAGPAGLACAQRSAELGLTSIVFERKATIGSKVCAGGITWNGLMNYMPSFPTEQNFHSQIIVSPHQRVEVKSKNPIIATVNREKLGHKMAANALNSGAIIKTSHQLTKIENNYVEIKDINTGLLHKYSYRNLVGADGSSSFVRRYLNISCKNRGVGINIQLAKTESKMEWHLNPNLFGSGYAWVFPHATSISIGAYCDQTAINPKILKKNFYSWATALGYDLTNQIFKAEYINFDYQGYKFENNIYLAGDSAGLASGLTGEGIYPAIISGISIANEIAGEDKKHYKLNKIIKNNIMHRKVIYLSGKNKFIANLLAEATVFGLKSGIINYKKLEMAD
ncbi:MAG: NAD(P)/FAD-dependent oxidoreductase [Desulfotalea sp.]